jgi:alanine racemase
MNQVEVRIFRDALVHNLKAFSEAERLPVAPVLKSNAYGHGLIETGTIVESERVPFACVNSLSEASLLRAAGVQTPLLVISYTSLERLQSNALPNITFGVISMNELRRVAAAGISATVQLEIDTGMHRHGILPDEIEEAVQILKSNSSLVLQGVYSHLADADTKDSPLTRVQIDTWNAAVRTFRAAVPDLAYFHLSATTGVTYAGEIEANIARFGVGFYGFNVSSTTLFLKPALEMRTRIASIRTVRRGETVGYNGIYIAPSDRVVATVPVGYNEGIDRRLSGLGSMLVKGRVCPILGRVSMNITSLDVTDVEGVQLDDEVIAISANHEDPNSIENIAKFCDAIPYEVLVHIPSELPRVVV